MKIHDFAKALGKRGGLERARRLSAERKKEIAAMGAQSRVESYRMAKRIETNFRYLQAAYELSPPPKVRSLKKAPHSVSEIHD